MVTTKKQYMWKAKSLPAEIAIDQLLVSDDEANNRPYADNDWGIMLKHYDVTLAVHQGVRLESKQDCIERDYILDKYRSNDEMGIGPEWYEANPQHSGIVYIPLLYQPMSEALDFMQNPPPVLRESLFKLSSGHSLKDEEFIQFTLLYAQFRSMVTILDSWNPNDNTMVRQRKYWNATNNKRNLHYAAQYIWTLREKCGLKIEEARDAFAWDIRDAIESNEFPEGWTEADYRKFLGDSHKNGDPKLHRAYGPDLTYPAILKLLKIKK